MANPANSPEIHRIREVLRDAACPWQGALPASSPPPMKLSSTH